VYAVHCAKACRNGQQKLHARVLPHRPGGQANQPKKSNGGNERAEGNDGEQPRGAMRMSRIVSITAMIDIAIMANIMHLSRITGKIVRQVMPRFEPVFAQADHREHELANQNGAANDRADHEKKRHGESSRAWGRT
jgi:hypothetical protein